MFKLRSISGLISASLVAVPAMLSFPVNGWAQIEEIVVTTRRREENLQEVPISITTLGAAEIERYGIYNIGDVAKYTAGMEYDEGYGAQDTRIVLRGLSPTRGRPNVAFLMDGIDFTGEAIQSAGGGLLVNQRLIDVERIEVVKGPQSALYGRSAFAGAVQYVTKNPNMEELDGEVFVDVADEEQYFVSGAIGGPVTERFGLRLNGMWYDREGFYTNTVTNETVGGTDGWGLALKGVWEPTENLSFTPRLAYSDDHFDVGAQARVPSNTLVDLISPIPGGTLIENSFFGNGGLYPDCTAAGGPGAPTADNTITGCTGTPKVLVTGMIPDADQLQIVQAPDPFTGNNYNGTEHELLTFTLVASWDVGFGEFSSYTGISDSEFEQRFEGNWDAMPAGDYASLDGMYSFTLPPCMDSNGNPFPNCSRSQQQIAWDNQIDLFSQEIRYASAFDGPVQFTLGGLYWNEDAGQESVGNATIAPSIVRGTAGGAPGFFGSIVAQPPAFSVYPDVVFAPHTFVGRDTEHWSVYGLVEWDIASAWKLSFEGRYVDEELTVEGPVCDPLATEALTGLPPLVDPITGGPACQFVYRGPSSTALSVAGGTLPVGTYVQAVTFTGTGKTSDSFFTPKVTLEWTPTNNQMWYFSWAEGKKPGGLSTISAGTFFDVQGRSFEQETLTNWEIGGKTAWLDNNLVINGAAFFQDYTDKQVGVTQFNPRTQSDFGSIENAGEAEIWGIEVSAQWQPGERWLLSAGYTWLDAEYTFFESITGSANEVARAQAAGNGGCLEIIPSAIDNTDDIRDRCRVNRTGNTIEDIPENAFAGNVNYTAPIGGGGLNWFTELSAIFTDERWIEENNVTLLDSYWLFDLRLGLMSDSWDVVFYVENVTDDDTSKSATDVGSQTNTHRQGQWPPGPTDGVIVNLPDPRIYGLRTTFRF